MLQQPILTRSRVQEAAVNAFFLAWSSLCQKKMAIMGNDIIDVTRDTISPGRRNLLLTALLSLTTARMVTMSACEVVQSNGSSVMFARSIAEGSSGIQMLLSAFAVAAALGSWKSM